MLEISDKALKTELEDRGLFLLKASQVQGFLDKSDEVTIPSWPEFMMHDAVANKYWTALNDMHADFQFALVETRTQKWIAVGNSIPLYWDNPLTELPDRGWDWALESGMDRRHNPNLLCALAIQILPEYQGQALSSLMIRAMKSLGSDHGFQRLIAPIRPNRKSDYPLLSMADYLHWKQGQERFDPWLRVHERLGATFVKICPEAMIIKGSLIDWRAWTGLSFQQSGAYIIPGALNPVDIDLTSNTGIYIEPNVWFQHPINSPGHSS